MIPVGELLRQAREKQGRSLDDIAASTRINKKYLEQLERGVSPGLPPTYVSAFIRDFAREVGVILPATETDLANDSAVQSQRQSNLPSTSAHGASLSPPPGQTGSPEAAAARKVSRKRQVNILLVLGSGVVLALLISVLLVGKDKSPTPVQEISFADVVKEKNIRNSGAQDSEPYISEINTVSRPRADSLVLEATASESVWVRITPDGAPAREYRLAPHGRLHLKTRDFFRLSLDNARALAWVLNGKNLGALGQTRKPLYNIVLSWKTYQGLQTDAVRSK